MKSLNYVRNKIISNLSFTIILLSSLSNFLVILILKKELPLEFHTYSLYATYIGIISVFGFFGFEQVFLRTANLSTDRIEIGKNVVFLLCLMAFLSPLLFSAYFSFKYEGLYFFELLTTGIGLNMILISYNIFRLSSKFILAQVIKGAFKILMLIYLGIALLTVLRMDSLITYITVVCVVVGIISLLTSFKYVIINKDINTSTLLKLFFSFALNIGVITIISFGERILIVNELGEDVFSTYFYYTTIFLLPFSLIQQYVGFKELVAFKKKLEKGIVLKKIYTILPLLALVCLGILVVVLVDNNTFLSVDLKKDWVLIVFFFGLGITKVIYGLFSSILGAKASSNQVFRVNYLTLFILAISAIFFFVTAVSLVSILVFLILIFGLRSLYIYNIYVR